MPTWADAGPQIGGENPFTEGSTSELGEAENIAVLGAKEGEFKEDALINVIK